MVVQSIIVNDEAQTIALANDLALIAKCCDLITLSGDLGAGKSLFARAFVRRYLGLPDVEVPSPTYPIAIEYIDKSGDNSGKYVAHMDLYRISGGEELDELGLEDALEKGIVLMEWPERAGENLPEPALAVSFEITGQTSRKISLSNGAETGDRFMRSMKIGEFLRSNGVADYARTPFAADASARKYELVETGDETRILMDAPRAADGPVVRDGLPYSRIAHLAEEVRPFVAVANMLRDKGFGAPEIFASDYEMGLVLLEHLGDGKIVDEQNNPIGARYLAATDVLAKIHSLHWSHSFVMDDGEKYRLPEFDEAAMMIEVQLLCDWYLRDDQFANVGGDEIEEFNDIWQHYCSEAQKFRQSIVLRDYHSPNIIWREGEKSADRIGLIDFQDALTGPAAYDVASLAQDARVIVPDALEAEILANYEKMCRRDDVDFDSEQFEYEYAMMGAHRASKVLGFCVRVDIRDGKPHYRKLIPSVRNYLKKNLQHPKLVRYRRWCERVIGL